MLVPTMTAPVSRGRSMRIHHNCGGLDPSFSACSICKSIVTKVAGSAGCSWLGLAEFDAECNAALDVETEGFGAIICGAAGVALRYACKKGLSDVGKYVADVACTKLPGCN